MALEVVGAVGGYAVALGLLRADGARDVYEDDPRESHRFAFAVADIVGRTRATDLHRDVRTAVKLARDRHPRQRADLAIAAVLLDGPRRLGLILTLAVGLLLGVAPMPLPPVWAAAAGLVALATSSVAAVALSGGRIRFGDRVRWSYAALGEVLSPTDLANVAPRRWMGTVGAAVVMDLVIALRGMSDRWTHGLPAMSHEERLIGLLLATSVVVGALYTLRTMAAPELANAHLVSRRLEERTARQSALGAAMCVGIVGLIAGILPGGVDAADHDPAGIEGPTKRDVIAVSIGDWVVDG
jgi:hypothetical protein